MRKAVKIQPLFLFPLVLLFSGSRPQEIFAYLSAVSIHEAGHLSVIYLTGNRIASFSVSALGAKIQMENELCPYKKEILIYLAGPLFNLIFALVSLICIRLRFSTFFLSFHFSSVLLGVFNLMPLPGLDGERALNALLLQYSDPLFAKKVTSILKGVFATVFSGLGLLLYLKTGNLSLGVLSFALGLEETEKKKKATKIP